jgi:L-alanine-DL-glutamate epimerase-like enolase superfamily enzyme
MYNKDELSYHIIRKVNTFKVRSHFPRLVGKNAFRNEHAFGDEVVVKEIITDGGASGWGLASGLFYHQDPDMDNMLILGKKVSDVFDPGVGISDEITLSTFDYALHDLAGKILGVSCAEMFGQDGVNPVPTYDTLIYFDDISPDRKPGGLEKIREECEFGYNYGYRAFKVKIGRAPMWMDWESGLKRDIEVTRMIRDYFPDCRILVDANDAYTVDKMKQYIDGVKDCGLYWIEEPFRENEQNFRKLREYLDLNSPETLIADGETNPDMKLLIDLYKKGLLGVFQMDIQGDHTLGHAFGLTPWRKAMPELTKIGARISPHAWGLKMKTHYAASFCAGYAGVAIVEGVTDVTEGVDFDEYKLHNGKMFVPNKPGWGMDFIWGAPITGGDCESKTISRQV